MPFTSQSSRLVSPSSSSISYNHSIRTISDETFVGLCRFSDLHKFRKPNDVRALELADRAAKSLMDQYPDIVLGFGESDEYR